MKEIDDLKNALLKEKMQNSTLLSELDQFNNHNEELQKLLDQMKN